MKHDDINRCGKAADVERALILRMEERFRDGNASEDIAEFFLRRHCESHMPLLSCGKKRKLRTLRRDLRGGKIEPLSVDFNKSHDMIAIWPRETGA